METSISYYDSQKKKFVKVLGSFDYPRRTNCNFDKWLYSRKMDSMLQNSFLKEDVTTVDLIHTCHEVAQDQQGVVDLEKITSLFSQSVSRDDRVKELMFHFLGMFEVKHVFEFSKDEYAGFIRASHHPSFAQPASANKMKKEIDTLGTNTRIITAIGYQPLLAKETQNLKQPVQSSVTYRKVM